MAIKVFIPTPLRPYTNQKDVVEVEGKTVAEALQKLTTFYQDLKKHLYTEDEKLRSFVNIYVNDQDIRHLEKEKTPLTGEETVHIVPSIAGGSFSSETQVVESPLSKDEMQRYSRHLNIPEVGIQGQVKLKKAKVLCVGAGGLGAPASLYLAAAGVGTIGLIDFDLVDYTNLQRQILYSTSEVGEPKLKVAKRKLESLNPEIRIQIHETRLTSENALNLFDQYDIIVDGTDNFPTRYLVNDACVLTGKPNVYGSIFRFEGQVSIFDAQKGPCYRCLYSEPPPPGLVPSCAEGGVLGVLPGIIGSFQTLETLKLILGIGNPLIGRLILFDGLTFKTREMRLKKDPECPICGKNRRISKLIDYEQFCGVKKEDEKMNHEIEIELEEFKKLRDQKIDCILIDVREKWEWELCCFPEALHIPLRELSSRLHELDKSKLMIVHCKSGGRSALAVQQLKKAGFTNVKNLKGGINGWAEKIDPSVPKY